MTRWIDGRPGYWWGWSDLGPIQIPPFPPFQVFTDRTTNELFWMTIDAGFTSVQFTTASPPAGQPVIVNPAFQEPYISGTPGIAQIFISNHVPQVGQTIPNPIGISDIEMSPIYARRAPSGNSFGTTLFRIKLISTGPGSVNTYGFDKLVYTPTPNPVCPPPCT